MLLARIFSNVPSRAIVIPTIVASIMTINETEVGEEKTHYLCNLWDMIMVRCGLDREELTLSAFYTWRMYIPTWVCALCMTLLHSSLATWENGSLLYDSTIYKKFYLNECLNTQLDLQEPEEPLPPIQFLALRRESTRISRPDGVALDLLFS